MKHAWIVILFLIMGSIVHAQQNLKIESVVKKGEMVELSISSTKSFYVGAHGYTLFINNQPFRRSTSKIKSETKQIIMTFFIPLSEYQKLADNSNMVLVYGEKMPEELTRPKAKSSSITAEKGRNYWKLNSLNKGQLKN